jgi:arylamine N-acetyltransferase
VRTGSALLPPLGDAHVRTFLRLLGVARAAATPGALADLVRAHAARVPFENVSKLQRLERLGLRDVPEVELHLEGVLRWGLGGTCYANAFHLCRLLQALGYDASLRGADMRREDVHVVIAVTIEGRELLVDVGYGAPLVEPLPLDASEDVVVRSGRDRYVLRPRDAAGRSRLELHRDGRAIHGYVAKPAPRDLEHFRPAIRGSFDADATFMRSLLLVRCEGGTCTTIEDLTLARSSADRTEVHPLPDRAALVEAIEREFGIPAALAAPVVERLPLDAGAHG